ncbi:Lysophospholipase L2 [hydrothermal vent metagenome]|uniref:Lysophospholipase L2 n=1 Tax=hydrothermal vent metagenome TaxID=652676 RepID=A0A3B0VQU3_9ZZZZ
MPERNNSRYLRACRPAALLWENRRRPSGFKSHFSLLGLAVFLLLLCPAPSAAVPEAQLPAVFDSTILPFFTTQFKTGTMLGAGGVAIHYAKREISGEQAALVIVDGRTEYTTKYAELFYDLRDMPWSFYIYDHRGQGLSGRLLRDYQKGDVERFSNYVADLKEFIQTVVKKKPHKRLFILAHSMGGTIAIIYSIENPGILSGMILCSPMLQINTAPYPNELARLLTAGITDLGGGGFYVFGGGPYNPAKAFVGNDLTHSAARFALNKKLLHKFPADELGSPTFKWLYESFEGMKKANAGAGKLRMPILVLEGGADTVVGRKAESDFCAQAPDCVVARFPGGRHELMMEKDSIRNLVLKRIKEFITAH